MPASASAARPRSGRPKPKKRLPAAERRKRAATRRANLASKLQAEMLALPADAHEAKTRLEQRIASLQCPVVTPQQARTEEKLQQLTHILQRRGISESLTRPFARMMLNRCDNRDLLTRQQRPTDSPHVTRPLTRLQHRVGERKKDTSHSTRFKRRCRRTALNAQFQEYVHRSSEMVEKRRTEKQVSATKSALRVVNNRPSSVYSARLKRYRHHRMFYSMMHRDETVSAALANEWFRVLFQLYLVEREGWDWIRQVEQEMQQLPARMRDDLLQVGEGASRS